METLVLLLCSFFTVLCADSFDVNISLESRSFDILYPSSMIALWEHIYPGTNWCGEGNRADDLGDNEELDKCCRGHDHCPYYIKPGDTKYGLTNDGAFLRSHCDCNFEFKQCILNIHNEYSSHLLFYNNNRLGWIYFGGILGNMKCFDLDYPKKCVKHRRRRYGKPKCLKYKKFKAGRNVTKTWKWYQNPSWPHWPI